MVIFTSLVKKGRPAKSDDPRGLTTRAASQDRDYHLEGVQLAWIKLREDIEKGHAHAVRRACWAPAGAAGRLTCDSAQLAHDRSPSGLVPGARQLAPAG